MLCGSSSSGCVGYDDGCVMNRYAGIRAMGTLRDDDRYQLEVVQATTKSIKKLQPREGD